ncbi:SusC/RagA family TonB-linked outer membrane protein [Flavitalea sp.]|nr:TonB-dependent receptor [Flavitalea sp.]
MKRILFLVFLIFVAVIARAQSKQVSGQVSDQLTNKPVEGASVQAKNSKNGTFTDAAGSFTLNVPAGDSILVISGVGFETQEINLDNRSSITVSLRNVDKSLGEVVVVGYGKQKKVNLIGSVATISNKDITAAPVSSVSNALAGRLPGAIVQQRSGEPGGDAASIMIRGNGTLGNNSPLVVIDGIPGRDLNSVNANDIESISVLKDASAAIYGARAANGVILVTTKRGKDGAPPVLTYSFYEGRLSPTELPKMADAATYAQMLREMESYKGIDESNMSFSKDDIEKFRSGNSPWTHPNTNWFDATLEKYSSTRSHDVSVSGGSKTVNYFASFGTQYADGLYKNSAKSYNRYNLRANVDVKLNEYLNVGLDVYGSQENRMGSSLDGQTIFNVTNQNKPTTFATYPNGMPGTGAFGPTYQPALASTFASGFDDDKRYRANNKFTASLKIPGVQGLVLSSYYAYDLFFGKRKFFEKPVTAYSLDEAAYLAAGNTGTEDGSAFLIPVKDFEDPRLRNYSDNLTQKTFNLKLDYDKTFGGVHNVSAFVAYESSDEHGDGINAYRRYFTSDQLPYLFAGGDAEQSNTEYVNLDSRINYFGRLSYNYKGTYLFQFALRRDGSLRFSKESGRWGNFPSVLAGWNISNEKFWKDNIKFIDNFKLKASWGQMGNDLVPPFQYLESYALGTGGIYGSNAYSPGLYQTGTANPFITWEVANVYNAGFESMWFNRKITFNADFFYQRRNNILVKRNASVPAFTGVTLPDENFGIVDNRGVEIELGYNDRKGDFSYGVNANFAFARNKVVEFDEPAVSVPWQVMTGHPQGSQLLYKSIGIFRDVEQVNSLPHVAGAIPGDVIIQDYDGNGEINNDDRILFDKTTNPEITYGFSFNLRYKNIELSALIYGVGTAWVRRLGSQQGTQGDYYQYSADGRWTPDNIDASKPRAYDGAKTYWRGTHATDMEYQNQSYARFKNLQVTYTIPEKIQKLIRLHNVQVYLSGQNLFLIYSSKDRIWDPEFSGSRDNYPLMKVITAGARVSL